MGCGMQVGAARAEAGLQQPPPDAAGALDPAQPGAPRPVVSREEPGWTGIHQGSRIVSLNPHTSPQRKPSCSPGAHEKTTAYSLPEAAWEAMLRLEPGSG